MVFEASVALGQDRVEADVCTVSHCSESV